MIQPQTVWCAAIRQKTLTNIEHAIETVRQFNEQKHKTTQRALSTSLQESLDLLKIYTSATPYLHKGSEKEKQLAAKVLEVAKKYNEHVKEQLKTPTTLSNILRQFFSRIAGNREYKNLSHHEIYIPYIAAEIAAKPQHKITKNQLPSDKITRAIQSVQKTGNTNFITQEMPELDLFCTKCFTLVLEQDKVPIGIEEALALIKTSPISYTVEEGECITHLHQELSPLPGISIDISGSFQHDPQYPHLVTPIKGSFHCICSIEQTGFCHPIQYVGVAWHEKLLPSCILRPQMCPKFSALLKKKQELSHSLLPSGTLFNKAKALLQQKKQLFSESRDLFLLVNQLLITAGLGAVEYTPKWYEKLSLACAKHNEQAFGYPIHRLQEEWLLKQNPKVRKKPFTESYAILLKALQQSEDEVIHTFGKAGITLYLMQISEHLNFEPQDLTHFERRLLTSLIRQQLIFIYELEQLHENNLFEHLKTVIQEETTLFSGQTSNDAFTIQAHELAEELFQYYSVRFEIA